MEHRERFFEVDGLRFHVVEAGPEDGPLVVLLHGFPELWYGWRKQIGPLAEAGFRVLVPDQRGYNLSDKPQRVREYGLDRLAADVAGLIRAAGRERAFVAGHDWGAAVAWWLAMRSPERVERLAVLNVPHPLVMRRSLLSNPAQLRRSWYMFFFQLPWLPELFFRRRNFTNGIRALKGTSRRGTFSDADLAVYREAWARPGAVRGMLAWYRAALRRPALRVDDPRIRVPTLILWGVRDRFLGRELIEPSLALCDDGRAHLFDQATHWLQHEEPEAVNSHLISFFTPTP